MKHRQVGGHTVRAVIMNHQATAPRDPRRLVLDLQHFYVAFEYSVLRMALCGLRSHSFLWQRDTQRKPQHSNPKEIRCNKYCIPLPEVSGVICPVNEP